MIVIMTLNGPLSTPISLPLCIKCWHHTPLLSCPLFSIIYQRSPLFQVKIDHAYGLRFCNTGFCFFLKSVLLEQEGTEIGVQAYVGW